MAMTRPTIPPRANGPRSLAKMGRQGPPPLPKGICSPAVLVEIVGGLLLVGGFCYALAKTFGLDSADIPALLGYLGDLFFSVFAVSYTP